MKFHNRGHINEQGPMGALGALAPSVFSNTYNSSESWNGFGLVAVTIYY